MIRGFPSFLSSWLSKMPRQSQPSSTIRRHRLYEFIESAGEVMVKKCSSCDKHGRVCKVHVRSGKCSECLRRGQRCDVKVTQSEFKRLAEEKNKLRRRIQEARDEQEAAMKIHEKALEDLKIARAREERLRQQMDLVDRRAEEAIAVEERSIEEQEAAEAAELFPNETVDGGLSLNLSPGTWSALEGYGDEFWEYPSLLPAGS